MTDRNDQHDDGTRLDDATLRRAELLMRGTLPVLEFSAGFADRTMARLAAVRAATSPAVLRLGAMQRSFRVLAAAAAIAIVALGVHNTLIARVANTSIVEAAIGLQPVSAESVLSYTSEALQ